ncbi:NAD-dependent epimerase/dehydratase family protein [Roseobacter sp. A03A-229]
MRVFVTGATGTIGTAVLENLVAREHDVTALTRSQITRQQVLAAGGTPHAGDLRVPTEWMREAVRHDAIVHMATTFEDDMADTDDQVISTLLEQAHQVSHQPRVIYTGGCWLYGATKGVVADEGHPFDPLPAFAWMTRNAKRLLASSAVSTAVVHPAMVYHEGGGAFARFIEAAEAGRPIEIWGSETARWPLIHRRDLAEVYGALLDRLDLVGHFNAVAETGVPVRHIADAIAAKRASTIPHVIIPTETLVARYGDWALGPSLDQQMSGDKLHWMLDWTPEITDFRATEWFSI